MPAEGIHSTGRGGAGNIGKEAEPTHYADASIVHEGVYGESQRPEYSAGRGGVGNMGKSPSLRPTDVKGKSPMPSPLDEKPQQHYRQPGAGDVIPETAMRGQFSGSYHTGRGGSGNARQTRDHSASRLSKVEEKVKSIFGKD